MTVDRTLVTRHIFQELPDSVDERMQPVCAIAPGVLGVTGIETLEMVSALAERVKPRAVVAIDSLAAREVDRVGTAIQLTDTASSPAPAWATTAGR
jgi:spore protease